MSPDTDPHQNLPGWLSRQTMLAEQVRLEAQCAAQAAELAEMREAILCDPLDGPAVVAWMLYSVAVLMSGVSRAITRGSAACLARAYGPSPPTDDPTHGR